MIVDTSALIAVLRREPEREAFRDKLLTAGTVSISAVSLVESRIIAEREGGRAELDTLLAAADVQVVPVDRVQADAASDAFLRYGKGRHPAALNLGDLFAYALATTTGEPLLFKGNGSFSVGCWDADCW
jgi:ribonuclease VapC